MKTEDLIAASKEAFGQHPEDVLSPAKLAAEGFGWLDEILVSIQREAEGGNIALRIVKLAAAGAYIAADLEDTTAEVSMKACCGGCKRSVFSHQIEGSLIKARPRPGYVPGFSLMRRWLALPAGAIVSGGENRQLGRKREPVRRAKLRTKNG